LVAIYYTHLGSSTLSKKKPRHLQDCRCITSRHIYIPIIDFVIYNTMCIRSTKDLTVIISSLILSYPNWSTTIVAIEHVLLPLLGSQRNQPSPSRSMTCTTCNRVGWWLIDVDKATQIN
jgi:hypothetical protein